MIVFGVWGFGLVSGVLFVFIVCLIYFYVYLFCFRGFCLGFDFVVIRVCLLVCWFKGLRHAYIAWFSCYLVMYACLYCWLLLRVVGAWFSCALLWLFEFCGVFALFALS